MRVKPIGGGMIAGAEEFSTHGSNSCWVWMCFLGGGGAVLETCLRVLETRARFLRTRDVRERPATDWHIGNDSRVAQEFTIDRSLDLIA